MRVLDFAVQKYYNQGWKNICRICEAYPGGHHCRYFFREKGKNHCSSCLIEFILNKKVVLVYFVINQK